MQIISGHLSNLHVHLNSKFLDLNELKFPFWITQPFLLDIENNDDLASMNCSDVDELMELQNGESIKAIFASKQQLMWLDQHIVSKYNKVAIKDELMELQNDESIKAIFASKQQLMWLDQHIVSKYNKVAIKAQNFLLPFPTTYVHC